MYRMTTGKFDHNTIDSVGYTPDLSLINTVWTHSNGRRYRITGFSFDGGRDRWMINHVDIDNSSLVMFSRTPANFFASGFGSPRFQQEGYRR